MTNNIFAMPVGLRGVSSVWHGDTKIGICLTSNNSPLLGNFVPLNEISVMDNKGDNPLSENELKTITEIRTDIYEIKPEYENFMLLCTDEEGVTYLGERIIHLFYLSHRDEFLVIGINYSLLTLKKFVNKPLK